MNENISICFFVFFLSFNDSYALNLDFGVSVKKAEDGGNPAYGFNLDLLFGQVGNQFYIGTSKSLEKTDNDIYRSFEALDVGLRFKNIAIGGFFGGVISDAEDFLDSWRFSDISYQYGVSVELLLRLGSRWNLGVEARRHLWSEESSGDDYTTYWMNLNYLFSL
jgi:hypothetical protein